MYIYECACNNNNYRKRGNELEGKDIRVVGGRRGNYVNMVLIFKVIKNKKNTLFFLIILKWKR